MFTKNKKNYVMNIFLLQLMQKRIQHLKNNIFVNVFVSEFCLCFIFVKQ